MRAGDGKVMTTARYEIESDQEWRMERRRRGRGHGTDVSEN